MGVDMKKIQKFIIISMVFLSVSNGLVARLDDVCAHSNESVVKFRKKNI